MAPNGRKPLALSSSLRGRSVSRHTMLRPSVLGRHMERSDRGNRFGLGLPTPHETVTRQPKVRIGAGVSTTELEGSGEV